MEWYTQRPDASYAKVDSSKHTVVRALNGRAWIEFADGDGPDSLGHYTRGISIRHFDEGRGEWVMFESWPGPDRAGFGTRGDVFRYGRIELFHPTVGSDGKPYETRYTFSDITPVSARWDNAWSADAGQTWRTGSFAEMKRLGPPVEWRWPGTLCTAAGFDGMDFALGHWAGTATTAAGASHAVELHAPEAAVSAAERSRPRWRGTPDSRTVDYRTGPARRTVPHASTPRGGCMLPRLVPILAAALLLPALAAAQSPVTVRADSLYLAGDYEEAVSAYRAALRVDPAVGVSWYRLGISLQRLARYEEAVEALRESADRGGPGLVSFEVARSYAHLGRPDSTAVWMNRALAAGYGSTPQVDTLVALAGIEPSPALEEARLTADKLTRPCEYDPRFRQFDFWLGEWEVHDPNGVPQGTNRIEKMANGCLLLESWTNMGGVPGHSINYYDGVKEKYVQTWVGAGGAIIHVEGNADESGAMVFEGEIRSSTGVTTPFRGRWSLLEDGRVRQFLESSTDGGATWSVWFDGYYTRVGEAGSGG